MKRIVIADMGCWVRKTAKYNLKGQPLTFAKNIKGVIREIKKGGVGMILISGIALAEFLTGCPAVPDRRDFTEEVRAKFSDLFREHFRLVPYRFLVEDTFYSDFVPYAEFSVDGEKVFRGFLNDDAWAYHEGEMLLGLLAQT
ncbi:MAG: hypothetical protein Q8R12_00330 [bacterium]|nr:hypothetical protein [bacterium]